VEGAFFDYTPDHDTSIPMFASGGGLWARLERVVAFLCPPLFPLPLLFPRPLLLRGGGLPFRFARVDGSFGPLLSSGVAVTPVALNHDLPAEHLDFPAS
jgi:hypothetical protein